jgi:hypothetical protein
MALVRNNLPNQIRAWSALVVARAAIPAQSLARIDGRTPKGETGELRRSITIGNPRLEGTRAVVTARATAPQAGYTDKGTNPHRIVPRNARVLRFVSGGAVVFARRVNHPGNRAMNWWQPVLETAWTTALLAAARSTPLPPA